MKRLFRLLGLLGFLMLPVYSFVYPDSIVRVGACVTNYRPWNLVVQDSFVYLADRGSFVVIDVSNPANPLVRSKVEDNVTDRAINVFVKDTLVYVRSNTFLAIINVANPDSLVMVGYTAGLPLWAHIRPRGLFVADTIAFIPNGNRTVIAPILTICNVKDPTNPFVISHPLQGHYAINVTMQDSILFVAAYDSILILNAKDPLNLGKISAVPIPEKAYDVAVKGNYAYVTGRGTYGTDGKLKIVDISNLQNPQVVAEVTNIRGLPVAVYVENGYAYVAAQDSQSINGGIRLSYSAPDSAGLLVSYDTPGYAEDVYVVGDLIFVADYDSVQILRHVVGVEEKEVRIESLELRVSPNPFRESVTLHYSIPVSSWIALTVYDLVGREVVILVNENQKAGNYTITWDKKDGRGNGTKSGVYFFKLVGEGLKVTKKMVILE